MITSVRIEDFRGVREGGVEGLAPISILVGPNNSGKSTVLDAIAHMGVRSMDELQRLVLRHGGQAPDAFAEVVRHGAKEASIRIVGEREGQQSEWSKTIESDRVTASVGPAPLPVALVDVEAVRAGEALEEAHSRIGKVGQVELVVQALRHSMPGLTGLAIYKLGSRFVLHSVVGKARPVPAYLAGDGFKRFLAIAAAVLDAPQGLVLLEEPEAFQHPRYLRELATLLHLAAREGTQVILSTHSLELIDLLLLAREAEGLTYPAVHRMALHDGRLRATTLDREHAVTGRESLLEDLRS